MDFSPKFEDLQKGAADTASTVRRQQRRIARS
jgi:hypothetical protein